MSIRIASARIFVVLMLAGIAIIGGAFFQKGDPPAAAQTTSQAGACGTSQTTRTNICHVPPGIPGQAQTQCVANSAVKAHIANHPEDCVGGCPCAPPVTYSTCAPVTVNQVHGEGFFGNSRLAKIENGKVGCVHTETGEKSECVFSTSSENPSGNWVETANGNYARTGQAITLAGEPDGDWIVAARVSEEGTVPCVAPVGRDFAGTASGVELAGGCVIETSLASWNATGTPLINYATLDVCTSSSPHPDDAQLVSSSHSDGVSTFCYTGAGAALNDHNGTERDANDMYFLEPERCHVVHSGGYEVPAAKRPGTVFGQVNPQTPIVWRVVAPRVNIANGAR